MSSKPQWESLVEQLQDPDPNARRKACQRLAATADPAVIPFLRNVYLQDDDERVRQAAEEGLAYFKAMQHGQTARLSSPSPLMRRLLPILTGTLVVLVLLNAVVRVLPSGNGDKDKNSSNQNQTVPTPRDTLTARMQERIQMASEDVTSMTNEIAQYYSTGQITCTAKYNRPEPLRLAPIDIQTYSDLGIIAGNLDVTLDTQLRLAQTIWDHTCSVKTPQIQELLSASDALKTVEYELSVQSTALQEAILHPAPTFGPTVTLTPTNTFTPTATFTLAPETATALPTGIPPTNPGATALPATPTLIPTRTPRPTATPRPYPDLDYNEIRRTLGERLVVIGDLQNRYQTGILDRWQQAQQGETLSTSFCTLQTWPDKFEWTPDQQAALNAPNVADPDLENAVQLINDGLDYAYQARQLYEPSCQNGSLASTAAQGIPLAQTALDKLNAAYNLLETIRQREQ